MEDYCTSLLANAIVKQAADDYVEAYKNVLSAGSISNASLKDLKMILDCLKFFRSRYYKKLTNLDPNELIRLLDEKAKEEFAKEVKEGTKKENET